MRGNEIGGTNQHAEAREAPKGFGDNRVFRQALEKIRSKLLGIVFARAVPCNFYSKGVIITDVQGVLVGANEHRRYVGFQNLDAANAIFLGFGATPVANGISSFILPAGGVFLFEDGYVPQNEIRAVCAAGLTARIAIIEGVEVY